MLGKFESGKRRGQQTMRWLDGITDLVDTSLSQFWKMVKNREAWHAAVHGGHKESDTTKKIFRRYQVTIIQDDYILEIKYTPFYL